MDPFLEYFEADKAPITLAGGTFMYYHLPSCDTSDVI